MQSVVNWIFTLLDIAALTICSVYAVTLLPQAEGLSKNRKFLWALRMAAWLGYAILTVLIPMLWRHDLVTMFGLSIYYGMAGFYCITVIRPACCTSLALCFFCMWHR